MMRAFIASLVAAVLLLAAPARAQPTPADDFGVLVMAHGGSANWNREVEAMLAPLGREMRLEAAFGMADPATMQAAVQRLEARGARRIAVVRLFISGTSFRERTEQILGLRPGAGPRPAADAMADHGGHGMALWRIETQSRFALSDEGLQDAPETGAVLAERVRGLSRDPARESVLIIAHGPEDDAENARWIAQIGERAAAVRPLGRFRAVEVQTLREDWPEKRADSEERIRAFAAAATQNGGELIVIPYRVAGFGPYARVLEGINYTADQKGLVPSDGIAAWIRRQATILRARLAAP